VRHDGERLTPSPGQHVPDLVDDLSPVLATPAVHFCTAGVAKTALERVPDEGAVLGLGEVEVGFVGEGLVETHRSRQRRAP